MGLHLTEKIRLKASLESSYFNFAAALQSQNPKLSQDDIAKFKSLLGTVEIVNKWGQSLSDLEKYTETNPWSNVYNSIQQFHDLAQQKRNLEEVEQSLQRLLSMFS